VQYPKIYFQVGNERDLPAESQAMEGKFKENKIPHEFTIYEGGHDYKIWLREFEKRVSLLLRCFYNKYLIFRLILARHLP
jgi:enterochelin esterase-like enzyme